jgi:hypothetical protein
MNPFDAEARRLGGLARVFAELCGRGEVWTKSLEGWFDRAIDASSLEEVRNAFGLS